jgi:hypothetical protein
VITIDYNVLLAIFDFWADEDTFEKEIVAWQLLVHVSAIARRFFLPPRRLAAQGPNT